MPSGEQIKTRDFVFTLNNYTENDIQRLTTEHVSIDYIVFGEETGTSGTPHLQGFVQFKHPVSFQRVKRLLGNNVHVEQRRGTVQQAIDYCKKDGQIHSQGTPKRLLSCKDAQKETWRNIIRLAENNELDKIKEEYPSYFIRYLNKLKSLSKGSKEIIPIIENEWWYGPTGTGKSYTLWNRYPDHFQKELNKWWDNYNGQEIVAIEEWSPKNEVTASALKIWADRYPFTGQIKGGTLAKIRPKKIIVLSNYSIEQCFQNKEDRDPIKRRFKEVYFALPFTPTRERSESYSTLNPAHAGTVPTHLPNRETTYDLDELDSILEL